MRLATLRRLLLPSLVQPEVPEQGQLQELVQLQEQEQFQLQEPVLVPLLVLVLLLAVSLFEGGGEALVAVAGQVGAVGAADAGGSPGHHGRRALLRRLQRRPAELRRSPVGASPSAVAALSAR